MQITQDAALGPQLLFELTGGASVLSSVAAASIVSTHTITCGVISCSFQFPASDARLHAGSSHAFSTADVGSRQPQAAVWGYVLPLRHSNTQPIQQMRGAASRGLRRKGKPSPPTPFARSLDGWNTLKVWRSRGQKRNHQRITFSTAPSAQQPRLPFVFGHTTCAGIGLAVTKALPCLLM